MVVLRVRLEMVGQVIDAFGEDRDLDFRRTGVAFLGRVLRNDFVFCVLA